MNEQGDIVKRLIPHLEDPGAFYDELEALLGDVLEAPTAVLYRPSTPNEHPFESSATVRSVALAGDANPPENVELEALLFRENGLADEEHDLLHLKRDEHWFGSLEVDGDPGNWFAEYREPLVQLLGTLQDVTVERRYGLMARWIPEVQGLAAENDDREAFLRAIVEFINETVETDEVGYYEASDNHYTLEVSRGFDPKEEDYLERQFFAREQLRQMEVNGKDYVLELDENTRRENLFAPLNLGPHREGLVVLFGYLPEGETLSAENELLLGTLQALLGMALPAHRSIYGGESGYIIDELTTLKTEEYFRKRLNQEIERGNRYDAALSVLILEIENLDTIREEYGESAELEALRKISQLIKNTFRLVDVACRFEDNQFGVIYPNTTIEGASTAAQRFGSLVEAPFLTIGETEIPVTTDGGIATYPEDGETSEALIKQAELALYEAKQTEGATLISSQEISEDEEPEE